jgi:hypothetical protein
LLVRNSEKTVYLKMNKFEVGMVYYNPRTALFSQYRGNGVWGGHSRFYDDAKTCFDLSPTPPPYIIRKELIGIPEPMESNILTKKHLFGNMIGWISKKHEHNFTPYTMNQSWFVTRRYNECVNPVTQGN